MSKKIILRISIAVNIILGIFFVMQFKDALEKLKFNYVEKDAMHADSIRDYLDREDYGTAAHLARPVRGGEEVATEDKDFYLLGEYTELLFFKEVFAKSGNDKTKAEFEERLADIRKEIPEYNSVFDKIDLSVKKAVKE